MSRDEIEFLLSETLDTARLVLEKHGRFSPFGMSLDVEGRVTPEMAPPRMEESAAIEQITATFQKRMRGLRACAICSGVKIDVEGGPPDAIRVALEDARDAIDAYLPYRRTAAGAFEYAGLQTAPGEHIVFAKR